MLTSRRPAQAGFSLIEMMVTMAILGVLLVASLPSIGAWLRNTEIRNAAESILAGLSKARGEAVRRNQPVFFSLVSTPAGSPGTLTSACALSSTSASWVVSLATPEGKCDVAASETTAPRIIEKRARGDGYPNVTVSVLGAGCSGTSSATQVSFDGFGRIPAGGTPLRCMELTHSNTSGTRPLRIVLGTGGTVRLCDPAVTSTTDPRRC